MHTFHSFKIITAPYDPRAFTHKRNHVASINLSRATTLKTKRFGLTGAHGEKMNQNAISSATAAATTVGT